MPLKRSRSLAIAATLIVGLSLLAGSVAAADLKESQGFRKGVTVAGIREHQQAPGYWLTAFTSGTRFEQPHQEMNTFLTSLLVDLLDPVAAERLLPGDPPRPAAAVCHHEPVGRLPAGALRTPDRTRARRLRAARRALARRPVAAARNTEELEVWP